MANPNPVPISFPLGALVGCSKITSYVGMLLQAKNLCFIRSIFAKGMNATRIKKPSREQNMALTNAPTNHQATCQTLAGTNYTASPVGGETLLFMIQDDDSGRL